MTQSTSSVCRISASAERLALRVERLGADHAARDALGVPEAELAAPSGVHDFDPRCGLLANGDAALAGEPEGAPSRCRARRSTGTPATGRRPRAALACSPENSKKPGATATHPAGGQQCSLRPGSAASLTATALLVAVDPECQACRVLDSDRLSRYFPLATASEVRCRPAREVVDRGRGLAAVAALELLDHVVRAALQPACRSHPRPASRCGRRPSGGEEAVDAVGEVLRGAPAGMPPKKRRSRRCRCRLSSGWIF